MPTPEFVTFTGLDERTDLDRVRSLSHQYPIEWGVLFSPKVQGEQSRYPSHQTVDRLIEELSRQHNLAAHLCGGYARAVMEGLDPIVAGLPDLEPFVRVQINHLKPSGVKIARWLEQYCRHGDVRPITQLRGLDYPEFAKIDWLYDCSGGRGDSPDDWPPHPGSDRVVGYAGGLNPDNVREQNRIINCQGRYWLDMESGIRTDDWLDLDKCEAVCRELFVN